MKKLLLTSAGFKNPKIAEEFLKLVGKPASEIKILFIPTASRTDEEHHYVNLSIDELLDLGIKEDNIFVFNLNNAGLSEQGLLDFDAVYVCGGNTFYLMKRLKETKFSQKIKQLVKKEKVYVGVSAGSIVAGPDIGIAEPYDENDVELKDFTGLNLTDIVVSPHYTVKDKAIMERFRKIYKNNLVPLKDSQALLINDNNEKIVE